MLRYFIRSLFYFNILLSLMIISSCASDECYEACEVVSEGDGFFTRAAEQTGFEPLEDAAEVADGAASIVVSETSNIVEPDKQFKSPTVDIGGTDTVVMLLGADLTLTLDTANTDAQKINWYYDFEPSDASATNPSKTVLSSCNDQTSCTFTSTELTETAGSYILSVKGKNTSQSTLETSGATSTRSDTASDEVTVTLQAPTATGTDDSSDDGSGDSSDDSSDDSSVSTPTATVGNVLANGDPWVGAASSDTDFEFTAPTSCAPVFIGGTTNGGSIDITLYTDSSRTASHGSCTGLSGTFNCSTISLSSGVTYYITASPQVEGADELNSLQFNCS